ncbi:MAG TPA: hypothetical protein VE953_15165 [Terriglobales bacterium]|nr:hypothetical protein [Terriglobales bacterium]
MILEEQRSVALERPDERPPGGGFTLVVAPSGSSANELVERMRSAWSVVASWGRWSDEELGDFPESEEALAGVPDWLRSRLEGRPELQNWLDDLHEREWVWWSSALVGDRVKLDVQALSLPVSLWPMRFLVELAGGTILEEDAWLPVGEIGRGAGRERG